MQVENDQRNFMGQLPLKTNLKWHFSVEKAERRPYCVAHHGVRFPRARLAIGKNAGIETFKCSFQDIRPQVMKNLKQEKKKKKGWSRYH